jgi:hypothetical protein
MKEENIPQDPSALDKFTKEVVYAVDDAGNYTTKLSRGWQVKATALDLAWEDIEKRIEAARQKVVCREASPILFFMELRLMDMNILSAYTGFWKWTIKGHLKPGSFEKLNDKKLQVYAAAFNITVDQLKTMTVHED